MIYVPMSPKEIEVVRFVLDRYRKAMMYEMKQVEPKEAKKKLHQREALLEGLVQKLDALAGESDT